MIRNFLKASLLLPLLACGKTGEDTETLVHEKDGSEAAAIASGWSLLSQRLESGHPLPHSHRQTFDVTAPDTTRRFRIRFSSIRMEQGYDYLVIRDEWGNELERLTGNHRNYVSRSINGRIARIEVETDDSVASWGFAIDQLRHRGCERNAPNANMRGVANCTELLAEVQRQAEAVVRQRFTDGYWGGPVRPLARTSATENKATPAHSETNVQVAGVDEADIVKTDGNFIYAVSGHQLRIYRSWPVGQTALVHSVNIEGFPKEFFLENGRAIVLSGVRGDHWVHPGGREPGLKMAPIWWNPEAFTKVTVLNVTGTPRVESELLLAGQYETARRVGASLRVLLRRQLSWPALSYWPENVEAGTLEFEAAMEQLEADAIRTVRARALADWLPRSYRIVNGQRVALPIQCENFVAPEVVGQELGALAVATVDLGGQTVHEASALVAPGILYQSLESLFVTSNHQWSCGEDWGTEGGRTYLHQFDVRAADRATYLASGVIAGEVQNQFWMDEHAGHLRVAATLNRWSAPTPEEQSVNRVYILGRNNRRLEVVGQTPDLAPGERIFGAKFAEEDGYVVTFRQVDPLFVLDLADPRNPRVLSELKVPGFSTYLHRLSPNHLFTIGQDFELDGTTRNGVALSIFDVSDRAAPRLTHKAVIGTVHGWSEALHEHRAFTMYQEPGANDWLLAIPFTDFVAGSENFWGSFFSALKVFRVSPQGIMGVGEISLADLYAQNGINDFGWWYQPTVRRGVFVDRYAFAVSDAGLRVASISDLGSTLATVMSPPQFEEPAAPRDVVTVEASAAPALAIPDADPRGVESTVRLSDALTSESVAVELDISHSYRGDLRVVLAHDGIEEVLFERTGGSADDLKTTVNAQRFIGANAAGDWTLRISDLAAADRGVLNGWRLVVTGERGEAAPVILERNYTSNQRQAIPDADTNGIRSTLEVPEGLRIQSLLITVAITHPYRGDLRVVLSHNGVERVLHARTGGSADNVQLSVEGAEFVGQDARGTWTLQVSDHGRQDVGSLDSWSLAFTGEQIGR